jgi:hypothetical protein
MGNSLNKRKKLIMWTVRESGRNEADIWLSSVVASEMALGLPLQAQFGSAHDRGMAAGGS